MNVTCSAEPCPVILNATCVFYQGENLVYTGINTNDNLETALQKIDAKFGDAFIGYIFDNGVIQTAPGQPVRLGGSLVQNTIINSAGYTFEITGSIESGAFITTGGTSSQFVKGDGSLDSTSYQPAGSYITALTGDGTATGPGSAVLTLANVNSLPGTYGGATAVPVVTVNAKGLVTSLTSVPISFPSGQLLFSGDVSGSGFTGSITTLTLATVNSNVYGTNTALKFAVNGKGLVTSAAPLTNLDIFSIIGYTPVPPTRTITINGVTQNLAANRTWTIDTLPSQTGNAGKYLTTNGTVASWANVTTGTVTSVALTMPNAFSVANSPITSSGTLAVTANGTSSQYIRGDGQLATLPSSPSGGGASISYYLNGSVPASVATYEQMSKTPVFGTGTNFTTSSNGLIAQFLTDVGDPSLLNIPGGAWLIDLYFNADSAGGTPNFYVELYKYDGVTFTLIASNVSNPEYITNGTAVDFYTTSLAVPTTPLTLTDRLAIRVYVDCSGKTLTLHTENGNLAEVVTTFSTGISALNGLIAQVQFLATGVTGTDFNINSTTATHTFNLPTASASNRGALSSADWTTFNGKQDAITLTTTGTSGAATLVGATLNIPQYQSVLTNPVTGTGTANEISYWTSSSAIGSLSTATYPSLTELSYVKGVTSSIQTQFSGKQDTLTLTTTGTSGAATLVGSTLNIPQYSGTNIYNADGTLTGDRTLSNGGFNLYLNAPTTIGGASINSSAQLQVDSTTKGFLMPRMNLAQRLALVSPAIGLLVYQTDTTEGVYQYTSTGWSLIGSGGGGSSSASNLFNFYNFT